MYKVLIVASTVLLAACGGTPAYRTSEVPVPSTYTLGGATTATVDSRAASTTDEGSLSAVRVSAARSTPFWAELGDTTLAKLVREAQRANMDVRIAESRLTGARAAKHLAALDLVPAVTGAGYTTRTQFSTAVTPGLPRLPTQTLWDVGFDASWELD
ncbi:MAG TPA: hypothetical protein VIH53_05645, partial [Gemmatimonadaceae bacterium]